MATTKHKVTVQGVPFDGDYTMTHALRDVHFISREVWNLEAAVKTAIGEDNWKVSSEFRSLGAMLNDLADLMAFNAQTRPGEDE